MGSVGLGSVMMFSSSLSISLYLEVFMVGVVVSLVPGDSSSLTSPSSSPYSAEQVDQCGKQDRELLENLQKGMLGDMCKDGEQCDKIIVTSMGPSAVKQPTRQGLYFLYGWNRHGDAENANPKYPS